MTDLADATSHDTDLPLAPPEMVAPPPPPVVKGRVGMVSSRSSTHTVHVGITNDADEQGLVGSMVVIPKQFASGDTELALGIVDDVTTRNSQHEAMPTLGMLTSGAAMPVGNGDVRSAVVNVQAVYQRDADGHVIPQGAALSMSPQTGTTVDRLTEADLTDIAESAGGASVYSIGTIYRMPELRMPMNTDHFDTPLGAFHGGVFGASGSGKTAAATYLAAAQMRHDDLGMLVIDPQGQFTTERDLVFSLQGFAAGMGRQVKALGLLGDVQLDKNKELFVRLLAKTKFLTPYLFTQDNQNAANAVEQVRKALENHAGDWTTAGARDLLREVLDRMEDKVAFIYSAENSAENFLAKLASHRADLDSGDGSSCDLLPSFAAVLGLFRPGKGKTPEAEVFRFLFDRVQGHPRNFVVLNMVPSAGTMALDIRERLSGDDTKALLLTHLMTRLEQEATRRFQGADRLLNTMVLFDEAARYAPVQPDDPDVARLAKSLSRYAKELRKTGVGFTYILQEPKDLDRGVWTQLSSGFRIIGYGLGGASLNMVGEYLPADGGDATALYRSFPSPRSSGQYNFMLMGGVSPLSMSSAPLYLCADTEFEDFAAANPWILPGAIKAAQSGPAGLKPAAVEAVSDDELDGAFDDLDEDDEGMPF